MAAEGAPSPAVYQFEEIGADLERPPFSALRALQAVGILVAPKGWQHLDMNARRTLTDEGHRERVDLLAIRSVANAIPANQLKLVSRSVDPPANEVPPELLRALGPQRAIPLAEWGALASLDRFVLASLTYNTRLLWRALDELERRGKLQRRRGAWAGSVARCEIKMRPEVFAQLMGAEFLQGRALVLARGAGRRAARKASETFDLQSETEVGPIELDWGVLDQPGGMLWQAHVSGWDGAFLPAASLQAVVTAAVAICDMIKELDPKAAITIANIAEEPWLVGNDGPADLATRLYAKPSKPTAQPQPAAPGRGETIRMDSPLARVAAPAAPAANAAPPANAARVAPASPASPPAPAPPAASPSKQVQRMSTVAKGKKPQETLDETVQIERFKADQRPLIAVVVAVGLAGAGLLGYMLGR
jgi:molybdenum cofactor biosynthesis enzyme